MNTISRINIAALKPQEGNDGLPSIDLLWTNCYVNFTDCFRIAMHCNEILIVKFIEAKIW